MRSAIENVAAFARFGSRAALVRTKNACSAVRRGTRRAA